MYNDYLKRIEAQEKKDRYIASRCLEELLKKGRELEITPTNIQDPVDLNCSVINLNHVKVPFNVEVKERYKDGFNLKLYPNAELKVDKYIRMKSVTPKGTQLLYVVLLNKHTCLVFNLDKLDWSKVKKDNWLIKKTQFKANSEKKDTLTYFIPYELATATIDCNKYFNEYENNLIIT